RLHRVDHAERKTIVHGNAAHFGERCPVVHKQYLPCNRPALANQGWTTTVRRSAYNRFRAGEPHNSRIAGGANCREEYCTQEIETDVETSFHCV
ncbi:hypothetical protein chiPu_0032535, partial [Chiloscyllium punctatum]|nr:hypothetical protein [Chiloscyllium punctatum]